MEERKVQLGFSVDASQAKQGIGEVKRSLDDLGTTAAKAGKDAGAGLDAVGKGGSQSAQKIDSATKNMIGSIQRATALLESGSRANSKYWETLANQRGIDPAVLRPYLDQLDQVAAKQKIAEQGLKGMGMSAGQTTAALRMVPAQLTDIVTSLASGQAPLTVLIQQGGQLKDMFGGIGPAARAMGAYIVGLVNPLTLAAAGAAALAYAFHEGRKESTEYAKALIMSGNASGATVDQLQDMAARIDAITGTQSAAAAALAQFAASGHIAGESMERFAAVALDMEKATGQAVSETVKQFEDLAKSPVEASVKLNETTRFLTASLYSQIKALEEQGRTSEAAAVAQQAYADTLDTRLKQVNGRLGTVERAWRSVGSAAKEAWDWMLNAGRADTASEKVTQLSKDIAASQERLEKLGKLGNGRDNQRAIAAEQARLTALQQQQAFLQENTRLESRSAAAQKAAADQARARIAFDKEGEQYQSKKERMAQAIAEAEGKYQKLVKDGVITQKEYDDRLTAIRDKFKDKGAITAGLQLNKSQLGADVDAIRNANEALTSSYKSAEKIMEARRSAGLISDQEYYESKRAFINLETEAKEDALAKEIARYKQENLAGKDKVENSRKIADAEAKLVVLRAESSAKLEEIDNKELANRNRLKASYLAAQQAAQEYFDTINRQQERTLAGIGQGTQQRNFDVGISQIEDRYAAQRLELQNQRALLEAQRDAAGNSLFTADEKQKHDERLALIEQFQARSIQSYAAYYAELMRKQGSWELGAQEAFRNYADYANNAFSQTHDLVAGSFRGMEDALVSFVKTGKMDFKDLADFMISEIIRIQVRSMIANATGGSGGWLSTILNAAIGSFTGGTGASSTVNGVSWTSGYDIGARAIGGPVSAGGLYQVNERGPELLNVAGKQYLMMGNQSGSVTPDAGGPMNLTIINQTSAPIGRVTERQISPTERALIVEEAAHATAASLGNPNSVMSKSLNRNFNVSRSR